MVTNNIESGNLEIGFALLAKERQTEMFADNKYIRWALPIVYDSAGVYDKITRTP